MYFLIHNYQFTIEKIEGNLTTLNITQSVRSYGRSMGGLTGGLTGGLENVKSLIKNELT